MKTARQDPLTYMTLERQFCRLCWAKGERVKVIDLATIRHSETRKRQRLAAAHLRAVHPGVLG